MKLKESSSVPIVFKVVLLAILLSPLSAQPMRFKPYAGKRPNPRIHPYTHLLKDGGQVPKYQSKSSNYDKLLVILVDFQVEEPDDPNTTGNGKFQLTPDPNYLYPVGAPPHDREYFEANLEAMKYYYRAVSAESYHLQYDVWPKDKAAYTLPQSMGYYNPPNASSSLFVSRMEEYFKTAFETADQDDPELDFSAYGHYMIIHAGSDWQHDTLGDTPSDIPSFFIRVGDGKQAIVDNGDTEIFHACNVPATISQDFQTEPFDNETLHSGYGALNAVLFHEFGHSLGLVDLYNVRNFFPMVGAFDIMDSGGGGLILDRIPGAGFVLLEGALPALPGAFSRALLFEDQFRQSGYMKDIDDFPAFSSVNLAASSHKQSGSILPTIIKIPISKDEYYLIENRSVDPDGDGDTSVKGTLDRRVVLYPTAFSDPTNQPTYEYDFLLPSFITANAEAKGGGILAWHVNEKIIYQEGNYEDGVFRSNFDLNTVNTNVNRRGVRVHEADGLVDLGEMYSMYWTGTPYEYFHSRKAVIDSLGFFTQWSDEPWRPQLSSQAKPPMLDSNGLGTYYSLSEISDPAAVMSFKILPGLFDSEFSQDYATASLVTAPIINTAYSELSVPVIKTDGMHLLSAYGDQWQDLMGNYDLPEFNFDYSLSRADSDQDGINELVGVKGTDLYLLDFADSFLNLVHIGFPEAISGPPLAAANSIYVITSSSLYKLRNDEIVNFYSISGIKTLAMADGLLLVVQENTLTFFDPGTLNLIRQIDLPESFGDYEPVIYQSDNSSLQLFLMADSGNIYSYFDQLKRIYTNPYPDKPTQLAVFEAPELAPLIAFGIKNKAFAMSSNGSMLSGFPLDLGGTNVHSGRHGKALIQEDDTLFYLPLDQQGYLAISTKAQVSLSNSLIYKYTGKQDFLDYDPFNNRLLWYYPTQSGVIHINSKTGQADNPILWQGFRNGGSGVSHGSIRNPVLPSPKLNAYVYPNPVQKATFRLRMENANQPTKVSVFDISGVRIQLHQLPRDDSTVRELELDASRLSSGVYIISVETGPEHKTLKFAVEK